MRHKLNIFKNKRGLTLIELIVAIALTIIILVSSTNFVMPMYEFYSESVNEAKGIKVSGLMEKKIKEYLPTALEAYVTTAVSISPSGANYKYLYITSGKFVFKVADQNGIITNVALLTDAEYEGFTVALNIYTKTKNNAATYKYTVLVIQLILTKGTVSVPRTFSVDLFNMDVLESRKIDILESHTDGNHSESVAYKSLKFKTF